MNFKPRILVPEPFTIPCYCYSQVSLFSNLYHKTGRFHIWNEHLASHFTQRETEPGKGSMTRTGSVAPESSCRLHSLGGRRHPPLPCPRQHISLASLIERSHCFLSPISLSLPSRDNVHGQLRLQKIDLSFFLFTSQLPKIAVTRL